MSLTLAASRKRHTRTRSSRRMSPRFGIFSLLLDATALILLTLLGWLLTAACHLWALAARLLGRSKK